MITRTLIAIVAVAALAVPAIGAKHGHGKERAPL